MSPARPSLPPWTRPTVLAPMEGVTHPTFRALLAGEGGLGMVCTEFVRVSRAPLAPETLRRAVVKAPGVPLSVQVMGNEADKMAEAAALVAEAGADVVDLNVGCPMPRIVRKGVGAAMLRDPDLLARVLESMRAAVPGLLSVKMRAGYDDADEVVAIAGLCERVGVDFLAVHPRRRCDFYEGVADWRIIGVLASELRIPVVGNGDVWYASDALRMRAETECAAVMIGRPALRNPWIFRQIAELEDGGEPFAPSGRDVVDYFGRLREALDAAFPLARHGSLGKLKEVVRWIGRAVRDDGAFAREALRAPDVAGLFDVCERRLAGRAAADLDLDARPVRPLERSGDGSIAASAA